MNITVAIPTFNRAESLETTLNSLANVVVPDGMGCDVLVVDNASTDGTRDLVRRARPNYPMPLRSVIETQPGLCFGRNLALKEAEGDFVVYLDDDVLVSRTWLTAYREAYTTLKADCVVGPVIPVFPTPLPSHATPYVLRILGSSYSQKGMTPFVMPSSRCHEIPGCNFAVKRRLAVSIGGFDSRFDRSGFKLLSGGDTEFGIRLSQSKAIVAYAPGCSVQHLIGERKLEPEYLRRLADAAGMTRAMLRAKHGPALNAIQWLSAWKRTGGMWLRWQRCRWRGESPAALEWELRTRWHAGDLLSALTSNIVPVPPPKANSQHRPTAKT